MSEVAIITNFENLVVEVVDSTGKSIYLLEGENLKLVLEESLEKFFSSFTNNTPKSSNYDPKKDLARSNESQIAALRAIRDLAVQHGYAPSVRDVGEAIGRSSSSTAQRIIDYLKKREWIEYTPKVARSIKITEKGLKILEADGS